MRIAWTEDLALGVVELDDQHRELYAQVDRFLEAMTAGRSSDLGDILTYLGSYAGQHFAAEERIMLEGGYPGAQRHIEVHRDFASQLAARSRAYRERGAKPSLAVELCSWLTDWLRTHLRGEDAALGRWIRSRRPAALTPSAPASRRDR